MNSIDSQFANRRIVALQPGTLQAAMLDRLTRTLGKNPDTATPRDIYDALSMAVREELMLRWLATQRRVANAHVKRVCYFSVEFLPGRSLLNALSSLEGELLQEAAVGGILNNARDNARATVATLLLGLGFEKIEVD